MIAPEPLATWEELSVRPELVHVMQRYLEQIGCLLRPGSVSGADLALRSFGEFLIQCAPEVPTTDPRTRADHDLYRATCSAELSDSGDREQAGAAECVHRQDHPGVQPHPSRAPLGPEDQARGVDQGQQHGKGGEIDVSVLGLWQD